MRTLLILITLFQFFNSVACDCATKTVLEAYNNSNLVVKAKVIKLEPKFHILSSAEVDSIQKISSRILLSDTITYYEYTFQIESAFKSNSADTITIRSGARKSNCDVHFKLNESYLVYAHDGSMDEHHLYPKVSRYPVYYTSICSRTTKKWRKEMRLIKKDLQ